MYKPGKTLTQILTLALFLGEHVIHIAAMGKTDAGAAQAPATISASAAVQVTLSGVDSSASWDSSLPAVEQFDLPVLYLHHNGKAATEAERTLTVNVSGLAGGTAVEVEIVSWHEDPTTRKQLRQVGRFSLPEGPCSAQQPCTLRWTLDAATVSDLYRLTLRDDQGRVLWQNPQPDRPDLVALDTREIKLDGYTVRVTYAALFPFAKGQKQLYYRLAPEAVHQFIAQKLVPIIAETWKTQFGAWGFGPIHPNWDTDKVVEIIFTCPPFALFGGIGTYTTATYTDGSPYPERRMWLLPSHNTLQNYDTLENGYRIIFSHEFFHMVQWNVLLSAGCPTRNWKNLFIEAQAKFASSVQYPDLEMSKSYLTTGASEYSSAARRFLELRLKTPYAALEAEPSELYDAALYWRFLYEQTGSMRVIRAALEQAACQPETDIPTSLDKIVDAALARRNGTIRTFEESMVAFGQANYALRLENGRCTTTDRNACKARHYDPQQMYTAPALQAELHYRGLRVAYQGSVPASFGTDLIEVPLDPSLRGQPLTITFHSQGARFSVQAWKLKRQVAQGKATVRSVTPQPEALSGDCNSECRYTIPALDPAQADRRGEYSLALIIVRLDLNEKSDPVGAYQVIVDSAQ